MTAEIGPSLTTYRWWLGASLLLAFGPMIHFVLRDVAGLGGHLGLNDSFELLITCSLFEFVAAFVAGSLVARLKRAREERGLPTARVRPYLLGSRLAFWFSVTALSWIPFALAFLLALGFSSGG